MSKGRHLIVDCENIPFDICVDDKLLLNVLVEAVNYAKGNIINTSRYKFGHNSSPGCTVFIMLDESHISLHTYAEEGKIALDIFTCGSEVDCKVILKFFKKRLSLAEKNMKVAEISRL